MENEQKFKQIENVIIDIMTKDGPDGHCDGSEIITEFIMAIIEGKGEEWKREYRRLNDIEDEYWEEA